MMEIYYSKSVYGLALLYVIGDSFKWSTYFNTSTMQHLNGFNLSTSENYIKLFEIEE